MKKRRSWGFVVIAAIYIISAALGIAIFNALPQLHIYARIFIADVAATILVYIFGVIFDNASVYDPYWSVQPMVIVLGLSIQAGSFNIGTMLLLAAVFYWGIRLTANWAYTFKSLETQDWRYDMFKKNYPKLYPMISFFGIMLFPTIVVYLAVLPAVVYIQNPSVNLITLLGFLICISAATLQLISDIQMHKFRMQYKDKGLLIRTGLWKYARHPNYLGEILMWWGVYIMTISVMPNMYMLGAGTVINTLMFLFISIPMADKRNALKEGYDLYKSETRNLFPFKKGIQSSDSEISI